jgi:protease-4
MRKILGFFKGLFFVTGLITFALVGYGVYWFYGTSSEGPKLPGQMVLVLDLNEGRAEKQAGPSLASILKTTKQPFGHMLYGLQKAAKDPRVMGVVAYLNNTSLGAAQIEDLRTAIAALKTAKKPTIVYSEALDGVGGMKSLYLASAFEDIWMLPTGMIASTGLSVELPFAKDALDSMGIKAEFSTRHEYKNAFSFLTDEAISKPQKEVTTALVNSLHNTMVSGISASRGLADDTLENLLDDSPIFPKTAQESKLITNIGYPTDLDKNISLRFGASAKRVGIDTYVSILMKEPEDDIEGSPDSVAVITAEGPILLGNQKQSPFESASLIAADDLMNTLDKAVENPNVKAIVLRLNSPGGDAFASDAIWNKIQTIRTEKNIPVVVSMGDIAASGGYYIAMAGNYIFAQNTTLTGSIGVVSGKLDLSGLWDKLGINWYQYSKNDATGMLSVNRPFTAKQQKALDRTLDHIYDNFITRAAKDRNMTKEQLHAVAKGRVWTGVQAQSIGLVDEIGGIPDAIMKARRLAKLANDAPAIEYPAPKPFMQLLLEGITGEKLEPFDQAKMQVLQSVLGLHPSLLELSTFAANPGPKTQMAPIIIK